MTRLLPVTVWYHFFDTFRGVLSAYSHMKYNKIIQSKTRCVALQLVTRSSSVTPSVNLLSNLGWCQKYENIKKLTVHH